MIVSPRDGRLVTVRQVDHQDQCAAMADAWGNDDFARPAPFAPLRVAAALHDEGWRAWEQAPTVRDGAPVDFPHIDRPTHVALYREGIRAAVAAGDRAGLLVSRHGSGLHEGRGGLDPGPVTPRAERPPAVQEFLAEQDTLQRDLRARIDDPEEPGWEWAAYRLLQTWDALSLHLTWRAGPAGREGALPQVPRAAGDPGVTVHIRPGGDPGDHVIDPWPFSGDRVALPVRVRVIPDRRYRSDADLAGELAGAPWRTVTHVVRPA